MRRARNHEGFGSIALRIAGAIALAGAGVLAFTQLRSIRRFLRLRNISAGKHAATSVRGQGGTTLVQTPRWGTQHWPRTN